MRKVLAGITLVALLAIAPLARAATIFDDGFETGIGNWVSSNIVPVTSPVHMGAGGKNSRHYSGARRRLRPSGQTFAR